MQAHSTGYQVHPCLTDAVTHLGAILDTDRAEAAKVPVTLSLYKPTAVKKHVCPSLWQLLPAQ